MYLQKINTALNKLRNIVDTEINIMDESGYIINSTNTKKIGEYDLEVKNKKSINGVNKKGKYIYYFNDDAQSNKIIVSIKTDENDSNEFAEIIGFLFTQNFEEISEHDFLKGLLLRNIKGKDIEKYCKKFNITLKGKMQVVLIEVDEVISSDVENLIHEICLEEIFVKINDMNFAIIKNCEVDVNDIEKSIYDAIFSELLYEPKIGIGIVIDDINMLPLSYEKAIEAVKLGKVFIDNKNIYYYKDLVLPILINYLKDKDLETLRAHMNDGMSDVLSDNELVITASKFFENNLNITETAKKLYIHRNTLIYRLNKISKLTGYDLRVFEDSINFKISLYINRQIKKLKNE